IISKYTLNLQLQLQLQLQNQNQNQNQNQCLHLCRLQQGQIMSVGEHPQLLVEELELRALNRGIIDIDIDNV
ncbi:MAG TPA: hypothetical protein V6D20_19410, partial [Candidatus Obscuribacterales bacterium]